MSAEGRAGGQHKLEIQAPIERLVNAHRPMRGLAGTVYAVIKVLENKGVVIQRDEVRLLNKARK